jgi:hypothetical protein
MAVNQRSSGERWDVPALRAGASVCAVFAVPLQVIAQVLGRDSGLADLLTVVSFGGFVLGGGVAAWSQRRQLALSHSLVTVLGTFLVLQLLFVLARAVSGVFGPVPSQNIFAVFASPEKRSTIANLVMLRLASR